MNRYTHAMCLLTGFALGWGAAHIDWSHPTALWVGLAVGIVYSAAVIIYRKQFR